MRLTEKDVRHVAELANLELRDDEIAKMARELDEILTHIDKLNEVDTSNIEPMVSTLGASTLGASQLNGAPQTASGGDEPSTLREDEERPTLGTAAAIANAPLKSPSGPGAGYFKVPKVIER